MHKNLIRRCKLLLAAVFGFIVLTGIAMIAYPGGSLHDRVTIHYNFFENFFSDLGATMTPSGKKNTISNILFITALGGLGLVMIYFSKIWRGMDTDIHKLSAVGYLSKLCLILSGASFIGVAFTPWNAYFNYHVLFVKSAFVFLLAWTILMIILQAGNIKIRKLLTANIIYVFILGWYVYYLFYGPKFGTDQDLEFQAGAEKAIVYITFINMAFQAAGIQRFLRTADFRKGGSKNFYV
ncbi:MAG: hypothetical protein ABI462_13495 [Ignavibacteria bacterium]